MSSAGGGSGIGGNNSRAFTVMDGGQVQLPSGVKVDLKTEQGVAAAKAQLSAAQLGELTQSMAVAGYKLEGNIFVPKDSYGTRQTTGVGTGPTSTSAGLSATDQEIINAVFIKNGLPNPYNANTTEKLYGQIKTTAAFTSAVGASNAFMANPTALNKAEFLNKMKALEAQNGKANIMEVLFLVFRESIQETNEDKKYFLIKLQEFNEMAEGLSKYLSELVDASQRLSEASIGQKYPEKTTIPVTVRSFDLSTLGTNNDAAKTSKVAEIDALTKQRDAKQQQLAAADAANPPTQESWGGGEFGGYIPGNDPNAALRAEVAGLNSQITAGNEQLKSMWSDSRLAQVSSSTRNLDRAGLNDTIKDVESMQETVRNKRQMASTAFQNFDQKANQLYNLMASVLKSVNEMRGGVVRNMM